MSTQEAIRDSCNHPALDLQGYCEVCGKLIIPEWNQ